jgi:hypothetical protein
MPEELSLEFIGAQLAKLLDGQRETNGRLDRIETEQERLATMLGKVTDIVLRIAEAQDRHSELLGSHGARLNAIEGRLALIEQHTGLVKA